MSCSVMTRKDTTEILFEATLYVDGMPQYDLVRHGTRVNIQDQTAVDSDEDASSQDSANSSHRIEFDPMHATLPSSTDRTILPFVSDLHISDRVVDKEGVEWVCRSCFCGTETCDGKALKRVVGKTELDPWDRGRPLKRRSDRI